MVGLNAYVTGHGQFSAQIEQLVLNTGEGGADVGVQRMGQDDADDAVEFVDGAEQFYPQVVFGES